MKKYIKKREWFIFICCLALVISLPLSYKSIYAAIYKWKEPRFIMPLYLKDRVFTLRNDEWGKGYFGAKRKGGKLHKGIDIKADVGTVAYAAKSGRAIRGYEPKGMGKYIKITHPGGCSTLYGHLKEWLVKSNSWVKQGEIIGLVGKSGNANIQAIQSHLHFEIRNGEKVEDPVRYLLSSE